MNANFQVKVLPHRIHVTLKDCEALFGVHAADDLVRSRVKDFRNTQFDASITGPRGTIGNIPLFLPLFSNCTQVMITLSDAKALGVEAPICHNPENCSTPGINVTGPSGTVSLKSGVHIPCRRLYLRPAGHTNPRLRDEDTVFVAPAMSKSKSKPNGSRVLIFGDVVILYNADFSQGFYIDAEEAAASNLNNGDLVRIVGSITEHEFRSDPHKKRKKRLISENDVRQAILNGEKVIVESWMMLTPAARDLGREHKVLVYRE